MARARPATSPTGVFVARSSGVFRIKGKLHRYHVGETFPAGHPLLKVRPQSFAPLTFGDEPEPVTEEA